MNSEGSGLGLQIQGGLASQWFESTFCAPLFLVTKKSAPKVRLELTTYRLTAGRAADCAIRDHLKCEVKNTKLLHAGFEPATFGS
jgi:hypothetical protein